MEFDGKTNKKTKNGNQTEKPKKKKMIERGKELVRIWDWDWDWVLGGVFLEFVYDRNI